MGIFGVAVVLLKLSGLCREGNCSERSWVEITSLEGKRTAGTWDGDGLKAEADQWVAKGG